LADGDDGVLRSQSQPGDQGRRRHLRLRGGDVRADPGIAREILEFIEEHHALSVVMTDGIIGCPHQQGIDYEGEWCPVCEFWYRRDRFTGERV
jgi:hypothetical protein